MFKKTIALSFLLGLSASIQADYRIIYKSNTLEIPEPTVPETTLLEELEEEVMNLGPDAWYQMSDANVTNGKINSVPDKSGNGNLLYSNSGQELDFIPDFLNGYPVAYSNADKFQTQLSPSNANDIVYFSVVKPISTSTNVYPFSNYQSPSQGIFTTLNNAHGRPSGGSYIQTNGQNINKSQFNISGIRAGSGYMTHFLNNTYSNTLSTGGSLVISTNTT